VAEFYATRANLRGCGFEWSRVALARTPKVGPPNGAAMSGLRIKERGQPQHRQTDRVHEAGGKIAMQILPAVAMPLSPDCVPLQAIKSRI